MDWPERYNRFVFDMMMAGYKTRDYKGRRSRTGPAVFTDENDGPSMQDVIRATGVECQWDNLDLHFVVYPA